MVPIAVPSAKYRRGGIGLGRKWGITPAEGGGMLLPPVPGPKLVKEWREKMDKKQEKLVDSLAVLISDIIVYAQSDNFPEADDPNMKIMIKRCVQDFFECLLSDVHPLEIN